MMRRGLVKRMILVLFCICAGTGTGCVHQEDDELKEIVMEEVQEEQNGQEENKKEKETETEEAQEEKAFLCVFVCGAVRIPGVYELPEGSRIRDALSLAGGITEEAAFDYLNQAELITDGQKIYVPTEEEAAEGDSPVSEAEKGTEESGKVDINKASKEELMTLPGIGEAKAESILRYREEHGGFRSIEELMEIEGIKSGVFQKIKDNITAS